MTYLDLIKDVADRLNLSSSEAIARIGRAINRRHREITSALGLQTTRRETVTATASLGISTITFDDIEKIINVWDRSTTPYRRVIEQTLEEVECGQPYALTTPTRFAVLNMSTSSVTLLMNCVPQEEFTLYADAHINISTLSGLQEPLFPESFHDILLWGALADEYRKLMKIDFMQDAENHYEKRLSDLRMWIAKSTSQEIYQGKLKRGIFGTGGSSSGGGSGTNGALSYVQTGLITFDRDPDAPFAVTADSDTVTNLDADLLDGQEGPSSEIVGISDSQTLTNKGIDGSDNTIVNLDADELNFGTVPDARFPATLPAVNGSLLTNLNGTAITTGTVATARLSLIVAPTVVTLVDGATPALDASLGSVFILVAVGNRTIAVPTNPVNGQKIVIRHLASGGARTLSLNSGAGGFRFGSDVAALTATASGKIDYVGCIYNSTDSKWDVIAVSKGY